MTFSLSVESQVGETFLTRTSKSSDREPLNWLPELKFFENDFFLAGVCFLILKNFSKGIGHPNVSHLFYLVLT